MQNLENDMEHLFLKAAEDYSLKKGDNNWESISKKIAEQTNKENPVKIDKSRENRKYIIFLVLMFGVAGAWFFFVTGLEKRNISSANIDAEMRGSVNVSGNKPPSQSGVNKKNGILYNSEENKKQRSFAYRTIKMKPGFTSRINQPGIETSEKLFAEKNSEAGDNKNNTVDFESYIHREPLSRIDNVNYKEILVNGIDTLTNMGIKKINFIDENHTKKNGKIRDIKAPRGVYIGLVTAVDFSNVKGQTINNAGYSLGALVGYKFNRKISLETGLVANKKKYYSEGKYFNMDKIKSSMPSGMKIMSLFTNSSIIEIPLKIKYDVNTGNKSNLYITAGMSAYIITTQENYYRASLNGNEQQFYGVYNKNNYGLPAVANIGLGYEHILAGSLNIRTEPFLKIPLRGMGIGNLPVTSAGVQLSIMRRSH